MLFSLISRPWVPPPMCPRSLCFWCRDRRAPRGGAFQGVAEFDLEAFLGVHTMPLTPAIETPSAPWWKFGHVWLVISGPAIVIVAGFVTLWLAISRPDPVIAEDYYRQGIEINKTLENPEKSLAPAMKGRNHAATPAQDQPR